jgi:signal transduction histidine kinase
MVYVILIIVFVIAILSSYSYFEARNEIVEKNHLLQENTEKSIVEWIVLADAGLEMYDNTLNARLQAGFEDFLRAYEEAGSDPARMNLDRLKEDLGGTMDLYIIDEDGVIEYSTVENEIGVDFSGIQDFFAYITSIREGDSFSADRVVRERTSGAIRKYAYMPTPDHRYLLELGLIPDLLETRKLGLSYLQTAENLKSLNQDILSIRIYDIFGEIVGNKSYVPDDLQNERISSVIAERNGANYLDPGNRTEIQYLFVDLRSPDYASDMSMVVELTYTTAPLDQKLASLLFSHIMIALLGVFLSVLFVYVGICHISRPITEVVEDIDRIAQGDLDHRIRHTQGIEFSRLENSINAMVLALRTSLGRAQESERALREYNENLETIIARRTAELKASNEEANLYIDIMSHDINNTNTIGLGYLQMILDHLDVRDKEMAERVKNSLIRSSQIIQNVSTIRTIHLRNLPLEPVDLDLVIRAEISVIHSGDVHYEGKPVLVCADTLLPEVFSNLIGNAFKFMGGKGEVTIRVEEGEDEILVSVEDTGPGIPDDMKASVFGRFKRGSDKVSGKGLGLYIVRSLIEHYGGRVWVEDRVPGFSGAGLAIRFTLKRPPCQEP